MMEFLTQNAAEVTGIFALVILLAERVARLTPTNSDNKIVQILRKAANVLGINVPDIK